LRTGHDGFDVVELEAMHDHGAAIDAPGLDRRLAGCDLRQ
jgi:hypothetical protein